ncbi:hypothetical protein JCM1841_003022 [Sporobolomyces salmonicolor]
MCLKHGISPEFHRPYALPEHNNRIRQVADGRLVEDSLCSFCGSWVCSVVWTLALSATSPTPIADWGDWWRHARGKSNIWHKGRRQVAKVMLDLDFFDDFTACHPDPCSPFQISKLTTASETSPTRLQSFGSRATTNFFPATRFPYEHPARTEQPSPTLRSASELFLSTNHSMPHPAPLLNPTRRQDPHPSGLPYLTSPPRGHFENTSETQSPAAASNAMKSNRKIGLSRRPTVPSPSSAPDELPDPSPRATLRPRPSLSVSAERRARKPTWKVLDSAGPAASGESAKEDEGTRRERMRERW